MGDDAVACQLRKIQEYPRVACPKNYDTFMPSKPIAIILCTDCEHYHGIENSDDDRSRFIKCGLITHSGKVVKVVNKDG